MLSVTSCWVSCDQQHASSKMELKIILSLTSCWVSCDKKVPSPGWSDTFYISDDRIHCDKWQLCGWRGGDLRRELPIQKMIYARMHCKACKVRKETGTLAESATSPIQKAFLFDSILKKNIISLILDPTHSYHG